MNSILDITNVYYINLDSRPDRRYKVENELIRIGIKGTRFSAIKMPNGSLGCSMSHLEILKMAQKDNLSHVLIIEDDIQFLNPKLFVRQFNKFLSKNKEWDMVLLAGNNRGSYVKIDDTCVKITNCQTTTGYLIKNNYFETFIKNIEEGMQKLIKEPNKPVLYAIDQYWTRLQQKDVWYLIIPLTVKQRFDYSNIEKKLSNYSTVMLQLKKNVSNKQFKRLNFI